MRLKNSSDIKTEQVREIIRFVRPSGITNFDVKVAICNRGAYSGLAYPERATPSVNVRITRCDTLFPMVHKVEGRVVNVYHSDGHIEQKKRSRGGYLTNLLLSRKEALVHILAHELRHIWQAKHSRGMVWGSRGKFSERDADAYAIRKVREWRSGQRVFKDCDSGVMLCL